MRKIGLPKPWFNLGTFCTKIYGSATAPTGLSLVILIIIKTNSNQLQTKLSIVNLNIPVCAPHQGLDL